MTTIHTDELHPGDLVVYLGELHQVTRVHRGDGWAWPVAYDDAGWGLALGAGLIDLHQAAPAATVAAVAVHRDLESASCAAPT